MLVADGGPVGLIAAKVLSHYGIRSLLCERNSETTTWSKMDLINVRAMEIFRRLGLTEGIRKLDVPADIEHPVFNLIGSRRRCTIDKLVESWCQFLPSEDRAE